MPVGILSMLAFVLGFSARAKMVRAIAIEGGSENWVSPCDVFSFSLCTMSDWVMDSPWLTSIAMAYQVRHESTMEVAGIAVASIGVSPRKVFAPRSTKSRVGLLAVSVLLAETWCPLFL